MMRFCNSAPESVSHASEDACETASGAVTLFVREIW
jgi:hypothetical protein